MLPKYFLLGVLLISLHGVTSQTQQQHSQKASAPVVVKEAIPQQAHHAAPKASQPQVRAQPVPVGKLATRSQSVPVARPSAGQPIRAAVPQHAKPQPSQPVPSNTIKAAESIINQYNGQFIQKPSYNLRSPVPSGSLNSLMNSIVGTFTNRIGKRSGKLSPLENALSYANMNAIPDSTGGVAGGSPDFNMNNIDAMNAMISTALNAMNANGMTGGQMPAANTGIMNSIGSFLTSNLGKSKKIFDLPKQLYKSIGDKISGASDAAVTATVPIKDSFLSTLKSFYSYLKPSRSSQADPMASAGFSQADGQGGYLNFKRRQSLDPSQPYPYFANQNQQMGFVPQQQQRPQQQQQQQPINWQQWNNNYGYPKPQAQGIQSQMGAESQNQPQYSQQSNFGGAFQQQQAQYGANDVQAKPLPYGTRMQPIDQQQQQQHSGLYQRSKDLFNKIARKAHRASSTPAPVAQFPGQFLGTPQSSQHQLPSQILTKVQSKLGTLPASYNMQQQAQQAALQPSQQQGQQQTQQQTQQSQWTQPQQSQQSQQPQQSQQASVQQQPSLSTYYTQQPSNLFPYQQFQPAGSQQSQPNHIPISQPTQYQMGQVAGTVPSSTAASVVTSTSVSISKSISTSQQQQVAQSAPQASITVSDEHDQAMADQGQDASMYYYDQGLGHQDQHQDDQSGPHNQDIANAKA